MNQQVYQNRNTGNPTMPVVDVPDTPTRHRHLNAICQEKNLGQRDPVRGLNPDLIYVGSRGTNHPGRPTLYVLSDRLPLDITLLFADLEKLPLPGDISQRELQFSVWEKVWGAGNNLYVIASSNQPGYAVYDQDELEEVLLLGGDPASVKEYDGFLSSLNAELLETKNPSEAESN